jgi:carboxylate-amine ligase
MTRPVTGGDFVLPGDLDDAAAVATALPNQSHFEPITFPGCANPTLGVELEVSLIDPHSRNLSPRAPEVLAALGDPLHAKAELFRTIIELNTGICTTVGEVRNDLQGRLDRLQAVCADLGLKTACTGSHPIADWRHIPISADKRYAQLVEQMAWPARRLLICGVHVHVGVRSGEHAVAVMNALTVFLPHLLALSASSPYWHGIDTGMASCRAKVFEGLPTAGLPPSIRNWSEFISLMHTLLSAGSIRSIREIWWDIRPHPAFGTLELRICDGINTLTEVCAITAFVQCLVVYMQDLYDRGLPLPTLRAWTLAENKWRAARYGLAAQIIRNEHGEQVALQPHIAEWLQRLQPTARRLGCAQELDGVSTILQRGSSSVRQRQVFDGCGHLEGVVDQLVKEFSSDTLL